MYALVGTPTRKGFTIVELLVVIIVIAILAAITILAFNGIQQRARESRVATQLSQIRKEMELYRIEHGEWPFQATIKQQVANGNSSAVAWCNAASSYVSSRGGISGSQSSGSVETACLQSGSDRSCFGVTVKSSQADAAKLIYISSEGADVSPVIPAGFAGQSSASEWCFS